ncbi:hypothetical protein SBRCBS47491_009935 [Sporothrix bragantina]|uniref:Metallo-beta-lactamase domain-containing protein n=1 Tax=Sporothrix bragantina TaxID=671064 RepID=A0ABP0CZX1_9PEZI
MPPQGAQKSTPTFLCRKYDSGVLSIYTTPQVAIGQRALLLCTEIGNLLWDCITYLDDATVQTINELGGIAAIVISHPHYYSTALQWATAFDCPVYLSAEDSEWIMRRGDAHVLWEGQRMNFLGGQFTAVKVGGHFPGSSELLWKDRKNLFVADSITVIPSETLYLGDKSNTPIGFTRADASPEEDLNTNLVDIHGHRLRHMDEIGIELMILSLNTAGCQGITDRAKAEALATAANDYIETHVAKNPTRLAAFVALSMHDPAQAVAELERCMTQKSGFVGVLLNDCQSSGPDGNTMLFYDDARYDVFWTAAARLQAPVYIHPRTPTALIDDQMWRARPWPNLSVLGFASCVSMHLLAIITAAVLDRFPQLKLVAGHMSEHIPFEMYPIDHKLDRDRFPTMGMRRDKLVRDYFGDQVFLTTSGHFSTPALHCSIAEVGAQSVLFSIDYPFESIPNACHDGVAIDSNNALGLYPRLTQAPHNLTKKDRMGVQRGRAA